MIVMKRKIHFNEKKIIQGFFIFCSIIVITLSIIGDKGFLQLHELKQLESSLVKELEELKHERRIWIKRVESMKSNQTYLETYARERLGMVKNHEFVLRLVPKKK